MKRLGKVSHLSSNRNLILRVKAKVKPQTTVFDSRLKPVGRVSEFFGPVTNPFVSIKPLVKNPEKYVGRILYLVNKV